MTTETELATPAEVLRQQVANSARKIWQVLDSPHDFALVRKTLTETRMELLAATNAYDRASGQR